MIKNLMYPLLAVMCFVIGIWAYQLFEEGQAPAEAPRAHAAAVAVPSNLLAITSSDGEFSGLSQDKQLYVAYFGFTNCPDVCPTSLAVLGAALKQLPEQQAKQIQSLFISLDPKRDDAAKAQEYARYFHPSMIGLSPHEGQLQGLAHLLGVYYKYVDTPDSALEYSVDHSSFFYFLDNQGNLLLKVPHTLEAEPLLEAFSTLL